LAGAPAASVVCFGMVAATVAKHGTKGFGPVWGYVPLHPVEHCGEAPIDLAEMVLQNCISDLTPITAPPLTLLVSSFFDLSEAGSLCQIVQLTPPSPFRCNANIFQPSLPSM